MLLATDQVVVGDMYQEGILKVRHIPIISQAFSILKIGPWFSRVVLGCVTFPNNGVFEAVAVSLAVKNTLNFPLFLAVAFTRVWCGIYLLHY